QAEGKHLCARSFKLHRPRGIMSAGYEEPSALVSVRYRGTEEPNTRATQIVLKDGMEIRSQHAWPSVEHDAFSILNRFGRFLPAGFYYKTYMGPKGRSEERTSELQSREN